MSSYLYLLMTKLLHYESEDFTMNKTVLFHGTDQVIERFAISKEFARHTITSLAEGYGIYLIEDYDFASSYGMFIYEVHVSGEEVTDMTNMKQVLKIIRHVSKLVNVDFERYINLEDLAEGVTSGNISVIGLHKEINDLLESDCSFYEEHQERITYEEDCLTEKIRKAYQKSIQDTVKYYDKSFDKSVYICHRNPEKLEIKKVHIEE